MSSSSTRLDLRPPPGRPSSAVPATSVQQRVQTPAAAEAPTVADPTGRYSSAVGAPAAGKLSATEQTFLESTLAHWMTASDADVGAAKGLLLRAFGVPAGVGIEVDARRDSAVNDMGDGNRLVLGSLTFPGAKLPFTIELNKRELLVEHEGVSRSLGAFTDRDRSHIQELLGMSEPKRNVMYAASDSFDAWLSKSSHTLDQLLFYGYHDDEVVAVARLKPSEENPKGGLAVFAARRNGDHFWPMAKNAGDVAMDEVSGAFRYPADGTPWISGRAGVGASCGDKPLRPLPAFVMTD
jgi:hypothetical protein